MVYILQNHHGHERQYINRLTDKQTEGLFQIKEEERLMTTKCNVILVWILDSSNSFSFSIMDIVRQMMNFEQDL